MFAVGSRTVRLCEGISRREALRIGGLSVLGLALPQLLRAEEGAPRPRTVRAKSCIIFFLQGGQSQIDVWDLKPNAPEMIRGEFRPVPTNVDGIEVCEHVPLLAQMADQYAIIRTMTHTTTNHNPGIYRALTAGIPKRDVNNLPPSGDDHPHPGSVLSHLKPSPPQVPTFVQLSHAVLSDAGAITPGQGAGFLGGQYDPLKITADPNEPNFRVEELSLPEHLDGRRIRSRRELLRRIDESFRLIEKSAELRRMDAFQEKALNLVTSPETRRAFDLSQEPESLRERYGRNIHGQRLLLARRLIEAGVRLVTVYWGGPLNAPDDYWDTHKGNFPKQRDRLLPPFDRAFSALLLDLKQRGLLDETLVIAMGEFGRTPRIGLITANAGTDNTGRDHWPYCYSLVMAGAGIRGGQVIGESDEHAAYPQSRPVTPEDFLATIYYAFGIPHETEIYDQLRRPHPLTRGEPVYELW